MMLRVLIGIVGCCAWMASGQAGVTPPAFHFTIAITIHDRKPEER
jgi:hypothetical protein